MWLTVHIGTENERMLAASNRMFLRRGRGGIGRRKSPWLIKMETPLLLRT
jgi:hypothetical protein